MLDWIKNINKDYPEYWKRYLSKFERKSKRFVVLSLETTGLNPDKDVILSIGAVAVEENAIVVHDQFEVVLLQYKFLHENDMSNEFIIESTQPKLGEREAIQAFVEYLGNAVLVGHRIHFDVEMLNATLARHDVGRLRNEAIDIEIMHQKVIDDIDKTFAIDQLSALYNVPQSERISSAEEAYGIALIFLRLKHKLKL